LTFPPARYQPGDALQAEVWAVNDSLDTLDDCQLRIELDSVGIFEAQFTMSADSALVVGTLRHSFQAKPGELKLTLHQGERLIAGNSYDITYYDSTPAGWGDRWIRWISDALLR
jgi:hypothetical protein